MTNASRTLALTVALTACSNGLPPPEEAPVPPAPEQAAPVAPPPPVVAPDPPRLSLDVKVGRVAKRKTLSTTLTDMGLSSDESSEVVAALKGRFDFRKSRVGDQVRVTRNGGKVQSVEYRASPVDEWLVEHDGEKLTGDKKKVEVRRELAVVDLAIASSLYEAIAAAGEDPSLAVDVADVFAWDIDFYRDVRRGDQVRVVVEKEFAHGKLLRYGEVVGIRYRGSLVGEKRLLRYQPAHAAVSYFDESGNSARKTFLKSPLKYVHITSGFGPRRNPLSDYTQNHQGVDYGCELGTPVWAVADGTVTKTVRMDPGGGNFVFIRHANGIETGYLHLSRFGDGIHPGARVRQKQVVAYSGSTGMSTGPHLHYAMKKSGTYVNPLVQKFPKADPLPKDEIPLFLDATTSLRSMLDADLMAVLAPRDEG